MDERVDVVHGVFGEAAICREAVGAMPLCHVAIVEAGRVHALPAALAAAAPGMDLDGDAIADPKLVHRRPQLDDRPHIFVADRKVLVEGRTTLDHGGNAVAQNLEIGRADRHGVDSHQHLGCRRLRYRLVDEQYLVRSAQYPSLHPVRDTDFVGQKVLRWHCSVP